MTGFWTGSLSYQPPWQGTPITINIGDGPDDDGTDWMWMSISSWDSPATSGQVVQRAADHGGWATAQYYGPATPTLTIYATCENQAARDRARAKLQQVIPVSDLATMVYNEPIPKQMQVRRSGQIVETSLTTYEVQFDCVLVAPDPRKYSQALRSLNAVLGAPVLSGLRVPFQLSGVTTALQAAKGATTTATTLTLPLLQMVPAGSGVVVSMVCGNTTSQTVTVADTKGNTYTSQEATSNTDHQMFVFTSAPTTTELATSDSITITTNNAEYMDGCVYFMPNCVGLDGKNSATGSSAAPSVATASQSNANDVNLVLFGNNAGLQALNVANWANVSGYSSGNERIDAFTQTSPAETAQTCTSSYGSSVNWSGVALGFHCTEADTIFPDALPSGEINVTNYGTFETRPVITVKGPVVNPAISNLSTGQTVRFTGLTVNATDQLVLDMDQKFATLNGSLRNPDVTSSWWILNPGPNLLSLGGNTKPGGATFQVSYRDAFI